jgi:hypothetical protein
MTTQSYTELGTSTDDRCTPMLDKENSWRIYYADNRQCYVCLNKGYLSLIQMKNVDKFIKIWNYGIFNSTHETVTIYLYDIRFCTTNAGFEKNMQTFKITFTY